MFRFIYRIIILTVISCLGVGVTFARTEEDGKFTVVIDAGHGGKDVGATDNGVMEKNINLQVAKQLESLIKKKMKNAKAVMTRDGDTYLTLQERADKANRAHGDIFISIHTNSVDKKNKNRKNIAGSSVYTLGLHKDDNNLEVARRENSVIELENDYEQRYSGFDPQRDESYIIFEMAQKKNLSQSIKLAENIEKELVKSGRQERGVHQAGFWVLWATSMPSVLVELDFICNPESAKYMSSEKGARELAESIFKSIQKYEESWRKSVKGLQGQDLAETYTENSESQLEESYSVRSDMPVAKARTRVHKDDSSKKKDGPRKRRNNSSKLLSMNRNYENESLKFPTSGNFSSGNEDSKEGKLLLATADAAATSDKPDVKEKVKADKKKEKANKKKKEKEEKQSKKRKEAAYNAKVNKLVTVYKIQVLASADLLSQGNSRFCGLSPISTYKENNLYKYYYGESTDRSELEKLLPDVRKKIPDAFIVSSQKTVQSK